MRIMGILLSPRFEFEGLSLRGNASELGFDSTAEVTVSKNLNEIEYIMNKLNCTITGITSASKTESGAIQLVLVNNVHLYDFPLYYRGQDNRILNIPSGLEIVEQCVAYDSAKMQDVVVSYGVIFDFDARRQVTRKSPGMLAVLSTYFKPKNFLVKQLGNGEVSFSGKPGVSLKQLPVTRLDYRGTKATAEASKKPTEMRNAHTSTVTKNDTALNEAITVDFLDVVALMKQARAQFVYLPSTNGKYTALTMADKSKDLSQTEFIASGIEYAKPEISYSVTTPKLNLSFTKTGMVYVNFDGQRIPVPCIMMSNKTVFNLEDKHMQKLMVSCPVETVEWLQAELLARTLTFSISNEETLNSLVHGAMMLEKSEHVLLDVDTTNLAPIANAKHNSFLSYKLSNIVYKVVNLQAVNKWISAKQKGLQLVATGKVREVARPFRGYSAEMLQCMESVGIDIYTGIYKPISTPSYTKSASIEFAFGFKGFKAPTGRELVESIEEVRAGKSAPYLTEAFNTIASLSDGLLNIDARELREMRKFLEDCSMRNKKQLESCVEALWCYNQCAIAKGDYRLYDDGKQYEKVVNNRLKTGTDYLGEDSVAVRLIGIDMNPNNIV